jgi:four helix bundle protein
MQKFTELKVWQRSHELTLAVYRASDAFPRDERFGLTSQLRRAAVSVACNVAEGSKRIHRADYARFLNLAEGSLAEVEYLMMLARDLGYLKDTFLKDTDEVASMLHGLRVAVEARS